MVKVDSPIEIQFERKVPAAVYAFRTKDNLRYLAGYIRRMVVNREWEVVTYKDLKDSARPVKDKVEYRQTGKGALKLLADSVGYNGKVPYELLSNLSK